MQTPNHAPRQTHDAPEADNAAYVALLEDKEEELRSLLRRAAYVAEHLMQMIDRDTWRSTGSDDGQGHYEGDYHEAQLALEVKRWKEIADGNA